MDSLTSGAVVGAGSFRCEHCGYVLTLSASELLPDCPECERRVFARASLFGIEPLVPDASEDTAHAHERVLLEPAPAMHEAHLAAAREQIDQPGEYLAYEEGSELRTVALTREWTRIGRSLAADVRFDDPTVSRRHALIVRHPDGVRLLDDRSLNGVYVNGTRVDGKTLQDGDEIVVGRYRLAFLSVPAASAVGGAGAGRVRLQAIG